jgi:hypothetical protein
VVLVFKEVQVLLPLTIQATIWAFLQFHLNLWLHMKKQAPESAFTASIRVFGRGFAGALDGLVGEHLTV